ncbi:hypothetical protein L3X38_031076 [Prunus dulcis]|uniref:Uncharacterized protein n=1 Tax=Prunus dulcis TaxID=3755 RepID=A0AAD4VBE0_PRUDU|nr:hypothetical protein L3X38_031076 [Prunus dulcis]
MEKKRRVSSELLRRQSSSSVHRFRRARVEILGNVQFIGETLPKFRQKVSVFRSGPQFGGVTPTGRQNSGPLPPILRATGLITSRPISSGPLNAFEAPRKVYGPLELIGSMKVQGSSIVRNHAITTLSQDDKFSFRKSFLKLILWSLILFFVMGFIAGGFILSAIHNAYRLIVVVILFGAVATLFIWNTC